jgi:prephenate dehydrogenase
MTNGEAITRHLKDLQSILGEVITAIDSQDRTAIHDYFAASKARRDSLLEQAVEKRIDPN